MFTRKYTDEIYEKYWEPGFEWMSEEGFYKAVHVIAKDLEEAGKEASNCYLEEVARNIVLAKTLKEAEGLLRSYLAQTQKPIPDDIDVLVKHLREDVIIFLNKQEGGSI